MALLFKSEVKKKCFLGEWSRLDILFVGEQGVGISYWVDFLHLVTPICFYGDSTGLKIPLVQNDKCISCYDNGMQLHAFLLHDNDQKFQIFKKDAILRIQL